MPYRPQVGERKHTRILGDTLAEEEIALEELRRITAEARNPDNIIRLQRIEIRLLQNCNRLRQMLDLVRNGGE